LHCLSRPTITLESLGARRAGLIVDIAFVADVGWTGVDGRCELGGEAVAL